MVRRFRQLAQTILLGLLLLAGTARTPAPSVALPAAREAPAAALDAVLWYNGPWVTHPGGGFDGADASALQSTLGLGTYGFANQFALGNRLADDFVVSDPAGWRIDRITFFAYQTDAPAAPSTITGVYYQVWDGPPNDAGSSVVWGNLTTNRLIGSAWTNAYRTIDTDLHWSNRPVMANRAGAGFVLPPGTYWLDWTTGGTLPSGPWAPPITILGQAATGNAMQFLEAWAPALDVDSGTAQGLPFVIEGVAAQVPAAVVYLPGVLRGFPILPGVPVLDPIDNADGDGSYAVSWSPASRAESYALEEAAAPDFVAATVVYSGPGTGAAISGRAVGTYYYRVRASNTSGSSGWSNVETATVIPQDCPWPGAWSGTTSQGRSISFVVENTPQCRIAPATLSIAIYNSCNYETTTVFSIGVPITANHFDADGITIRVIGDFTSPTTASGTFSLSMPNPFPPPNSCTASGTWQAAP